MKPSVNGMLGLILGIGVCWYSDSSLACEPEVIPSLGFSATSPEDGEEGVRLNGGIVLYGVAGERAGASVITSAFTVNEVNDAGAHPVAGDVRHWRSEDEPALTWAPTGTLKPNTRHRVTAVLWAPSASAPDAGSPPRVEFEFTTGDELFPPLRFDGELSVELEVVDQDVEECHMCGHGCEVVGTRRALSAIITLPELLGGNAGHSLRGHVVATADEAFQPDVPWDDPNVTESQPRIAPGQVNRVEHEVMFLGRPYAPCFSVQVWDVGWQSTWAAVCADTISPESLLAEPDGSVVDAGAPLVDSSSPVLDASAPPVLDEPELPASDPLDASDEAALDASAPPVLDEPELPASDPLDASDEAARASGPTGGSTSAGCSLSRSPRGVEHWVGLAFCLSALMLAAAVRQNKARGVQRRGNGAGARRHSNPPTPHPATR